MFVPIRRDATSSANPFSAILRASTVRMPPVKPSVSVSFRQREQDGSIPERVHNRNQRANDQKGGFYEIG
jgi:hypothetical protein